MEIPKAELWVGTKDELREKVRQFYKENLQGKQS
jgi:hypothetical protein